MQKRIVVLAAGLAAWAGSSQAAQAARPTTGYVVPSDLPTSRPVAGSLGRGSTIFFNRRGGVYTLGEADSRRNVTNIRSGTITPFECGDAAWAQVMACLKDSFLPYQVKITDVDPGTSRPHVETVVGGSPGQLGFEPRVGGIAPMGCDLAYESPITFVFSQTWSCDVNQICWAAAQETAHAFGLDHSTECSDHMTYDQDCGPVKRFRDIEKPCGEDKDLPPDQEPPDFSGPRRCLCTRRSTQNSHQDLLAIFGERTNVAPDVYFARPRAGAALTAGFPIELYVDDDFGLARVEILVDGALVETRTGPPFVAVAPAGIGFGPHRVTARALDQGGLATEVSVDVRVQPPCTSNDECPDDTVCQTGECVDGPGTPGGIGARCTDSLECQSRICAADTMGSRCVAFCDPAASTCPDGFGCLPAGEQDVCWPGDELAFPPEEGGCGCRVAGAGSRAPLAGFLIAFAGFAWMFRRRRTPRL